MSTKTQTIQVGDTVRVRWTTVFWSARKGLDLSGKSSLLTDVVCAVVAVRPGEHGPELLLSLKEDGRQLWAWVEDKGAAGAAMPWID